MRIDVTDELRPSINGAPIAGAMSVPELHALVGPASRIEGGLPPAPVKHRNNQIHVYDEWGVYFYEHHYTRQITGMAVVFWPEEHGFHFTPARAFGGTLCLVGYVVPPRVGVREFACDCPAGFKHVIGGWARAKRGEFSVIIECKGARLRSGRRSAIRYLVDVSLSWPHDPWARPASE